MQNTMVVGRGEMAAREKFKMEVQGKKLKEGKWKLLGKILQKWVK